MTTQPTQPENNDTQVTVVEDSSTPNSPSNNGAAEVPASIQTEVASTPSYAVEETVQPFTAFIEEFRQKEDRQAPQGGIPAAPAFATNEQLTAQTETAPLQETPPQVERPETDASSSVPTTPATKPERPVSPLLRPATRIRMPRQAGGRQRETFVTQATSSSPAPTKPEDAPQPVSTEMPVAQEESITPTTGPEENAQGETVQDVPAVEEGKVEQSEPSKPARRYRFDRRTPATQAAASSKSISLAPSPAEPTNNRSHQENIAAEQAAKAVNGTAVELPSTPAETMVAAPEATVAPESEVVTTPAPAAPSARPNNDRRRRHGQEGQHTKAQAQVSIDAIKDAVKTETSKTEAGNRPGNGVPVVEQSASASQPETPPDATNRADTEIPVEDLPPLEYSELQAASRRRRRRRTNGNGTTQVPTPQTRPAIPAPASSTMPVVPAPVTPVSPVTPARNMDGVHRTAAVTPNTPATPFTIQSGMTVNQMNQGNDAAGPFQGPEPTPARGSVLPVQPRLARPVRNSNEAQRGSVTPLPAARSGGDGILSTGAVNHLANVISQAIQLQSDRMVAELRRTNQAPANVSVTLPPFPSTERVGVFVDVANLLYSARTLRMTIDFGKLLDFLRGNRRLVRAHAYCPTSPQPGDDQMFLQAVKGLGYRITTKNYKTFASGAKKADMDLDLCMDVVRLVDGKAVDCIVLVSGDGDFIPLLDYCSDHGVRVEVVAFDESMSASLRQSCDLFINLSMLDEIRV